MFGNLFKNPAEIKQNLKGLYYDPKTGYSGLVKLYKKAKEQFPDEPITLSDVRSFLDKQYTYQINRQDVRPKYYRTILAKKPRENYQMDIMIYDRFADGEYKYILVAIDVYSRVAYAVPLKTREAVEIRKKIDKIFRVLGKPKNVNTDQEFSRAGLLQEYFLEQGVTHHISETGEINKQAIVERFNRTLALMLRRWREGTGRTDWSNVLNDLIKNYNNSYHRTIKATPADVWKDIVLPSQSPIYQFETELEVGDLVRLKLIKETFTKGDALKYSPEEYVIVAKKDGIEEGKKLKKFRIKNIATNQVLRKPREWWKDYELKKVNAIVEKKTEEEDLNNKKAQALEDENRVLKEELEKVEEQNKKILDAVEYEGEKEIRSIMRRKDDKKVERNLALQKLLQSAQGKTIAQRREQLLSTRTNKDDLKALGSAYGLSPLLYKDVKDKKTGKDVKRFIDKDVMVEVVLEEEKKRKLIA